MTAAILTGGKARRLDGTDKSRLIVDGRSILERQIEMLAPLMSEILIVTSAGRASDFSAARLPETVPSAHATAVRVVTDNYPGAGPLGAIATALESTRAGSVFVLAGDMPNVPSTLVAALVDQHNAAGDGDDATVAESNRGLEPLCAMYAPSARPALVRAIDAGDFSLQQVLRTLKLGILSAAAVARHGAPDILFRNINTPEDL